MNDGDQRTSTMVGNTLLDRTILQPEDFGYHFDEFKKFSSPNLLCASTTNKGWLDYHGRRYRQQRLLKITHMSEFPDVYGGFSDVYRGAYRAVSGGVGGVDSEETIVRGFPQR
jgi:hypothetical protein